MDKRDLSSLDAIRIAMEAEDKAAVFYEEAPGKTSNPVGRKLPGQLSNFERHHHSQLRALEDSLCSAGACIMVAGSSCPSPGLGAMPCRVLPGAG